MERRQCSKCREEKTEADFSPAYWRRGAKVCRMCAAKQAIARRRAKGIQPRIKAPMEGLRICILCNVAKPQSAYCPSSWDRGQRQCRDCLAKKGLARNRRKGVQPRSRMTLEEQKCRGRERRKARKREVSDYQLRHNYGISLSQYEAMFQAQRGLCAACGKPEPRLDQQGKPRRLHVDHDHQHCERAKGCPDCVRALLCGGCNMALGCVADDSERLMGLVAYLLGFQKERQTVGGG